MIGKVWLRPVHLPHFLLEKNGFALEVLMQIREYNPFKSTAVLCHFPTDILLWRDLPYALLNRHPALPFLIPTIQQLLSGYSTLLRKSTKAFSGSGYSKALSPVAILRKWPEIQLLCSDGEHSDKEENDKEKKWQCEVMIMIVIITMTVAPRCRTRQPLKKNYGWKGWKKKWSGNWWKWFQRPDMVPNSKVLGFRWATNLFLHRGFSRSSPDEMIFTRAAWQLRERRLVAIAGHRCRNCNRL